MKTKLDKRSYQAAILKHHHLALICNMQIITSCLYAYWHYTCMKCFAHRTCFLSFCLACGIQLPHKQLLSISLFKDCKVEEWQLENCRWWIHVSCIDDVGTLIPLAGCRAAVKEPYRTLELILFCTIILLMLQLTCSLIFNLDSSVMVVVGTNSKTAMLLF